MFIKIFVNILLMVGLVAIQSSFIRSLPPILDSLNIVLVVVVLILSLSNFSNALSWSVGLGLILDIYSFKPFGLFIFSLFLTVIIAHLLLKNFFTNRSLYSFIALTFLSTIIYEFSTRLFTGAGYFFSVIPESNLHFGYEFWLGEAYQVAVNIIAVIIMFYLSSFISRNLKPVFLFRP